MKACTLKKLVNKIARKFGYNYPIENIRSDYYGITFEAGRDIYRYDYETEEIYRVTTLYDQ